MAYRMQGPKTQVAYMSEFGIDQQVHERCVFLTAVDYNTILS